MNALKQIGLGGVLLASFLLPGETLAGDAEAGKTVYRGCAACHSTDQDVNKIGPSLYGVVGRTTGSLESFAKRYSPAMKAFGEGGGVWDDATLDAYLASPRTFIPKNRMAFPGVKDATKREDLIAYLNSLVGE